MDKQSELLAFDEDKLMINIYLDDVEKLKTTWREEVTGIQAPLVSVHKNGFNLFIPWILRGNEDESRMD